MYYLPYAVLMRLHQAALEARRKERTWKYLVYSGLAGVMAGGMIAIGALFALLMWRIGLWPLAIIVVVFAVMPPASMWLLRHVAVPLGRERFAFLCGKASRPGVDSEAFASCAAAWAFARRPTARAEAWLLERRDARKPLGDAEIVVTALLAAGHGDLDTARRLLRSVLMIAERHAPVRELAGEWLAVDAAERGEWEQLAKDASCAHFPASPLTLVLEGVATRYWNPAAAPRHAEMLARWILAPHRHVTWALLQARPAPVAPPTQAASAGLTPSGSPAAPPLERALVAHLAFVTAPPEGTALAATVQAWDTALADPALRQWLEQRAEVIDAPAGSAARAIADVIASVVDELGRLADVGHLGSPSSKGAIGAMLWRRLRHGRLDALEEAFTRWAERVKLQKLAGMSAPKRLGIDEWREFLALHAEYAEVMAAGGVELRRLGFEHAYRKALDVTVWLWNDHKEYAISHAISKWLLAEALLVGDASAIEVGYKNCALTVPTRTGDVVEQR